MATGISKCDLGHRNTFNFKEDLERQRLLKEIRKRNEIKEKQDGLELARIITKYNQSLTH